MLEIIMRELLHQAEDARHNAPYVDVTDPSDAILDGHFNLAALAEAIGAKLKSFLERADGLDKWNGYGEGYSTLRAQIETMIATKG